MVSNSKRRNSGTANGGAPRSIAEAVSKQHKNTTQAVRTSSIPAGSSVPGDSSEGKALKCPPVFGPEPPPELALARAAAAAVAAASKGTPSRPMHRTSLQLGLVDPNNPNAKEVTIGVGIGPHSGRVIGGADSLAQSEAEAAKYWQERIAEV
ncbi:hypothetical protein FBU59_006494, partial [Linderina macrospora]